MNPALAFIEKNWSALLPPVLIVVVVLLVGLAVRNSLFRFLRRWAKTSASQIDEFVFEGLRSPFMIWVLMLGLHLGLQNSRLPARAQNISAQILLVLFMVSITLVCSRLAGAFVKFYVGSLTSLAENLARVAVLMVGAI